MVKYLGIVSLIIGIVSIWYIEKEISNNKLLILDYLESEARTANGNLGFFFDLKKRRDVEDSIAIFMIDLLEDVQQNKPYSKDEREILLSKMNGEKDSLSNTSNIALFNILCNELRMRRLQNRQQQEYFLVINGIDEFENESMDLSFLPIKFVEDRQVEYYYENNIIPESQLNNFEGELVNLEARILNPISKSVYIVKGK